MTFHDRVNGLCTHNGISITGLIQTLGFSKSAGTTWKNSALLPRNSTIKTIADHFGMTSEELLEGVVDFANYDTSGFNQLRYEELLTQLGNKAKAVKRYLEVEEAQKLDAMNDPDRLAIYHNNGGSVGVMGTANAPVTVTTTNGKEHPLSDQESELLRIFTELDTVERSRVLVFAAELKERRDGVL